MDLTNLNLNKDRSKIRRKPPVDLSTMVYGKVPPQAKELEEAVLGAIMLEKSAFDTVVENLKPECFYVEGHQRIYRSMQSLAQKSQPIDIFTVVEELKTRMELDIVGGAYYVTKLTNSVVSSANIETHARIILQLLAHRSQFRSTMGLTEPEGTVPNELDAFAARLHLHHVAAGAPVGVPVAEAFKALRDL
jgi:replicative DNA helicase